MIQTRDALILAAGLGTRLQPLTSVRAKPAIPLAGEPLIRRIVRGLVSHGVTNLVVNLHHLPATITGALGDGHDLGATVRYSWEPTILGSAGGPRRALPMLDRTFFIVNGDTLIDVNLEALASAHAASRALVTMALTHNREPNRYGGVLVDPASVDSSSHVTQFVRRGAQAAGSFHFAGVQIASADAFSSIEMGDAANSVGGTYDKILETDPRGIAAFVTSGDFWDIGTVADYIRTSRAFEAGMPQVSPRSTIAPGARLVRSIVWDDVRIEAGADIENCVITDRVRVPQGARYRDAILLEASDRSIRVEPLTDSLD